ncbi:unnamed protein product [Symbiodinium microadriaticum]|nr:unnamed protein product [Symbiodinium microadriaticum]
MVWPTVKEVQEYRKKVYKIASDVIANHPDLEDSNGTTPVKITWDHPLWSIFTGADQPVDAILYVKLHQSRRNESGIQGDVSPHEHVLFETSCCCSGSGMLVGFSGFVGIVGFRTWSEDAGLQMQVRGACHAMQQRMDTWANCQEGWCATGAGSNQFVYFFDKVFWHFVAFHSRLVPVLALVGLHQILLVLLDCLLPLLVTADPVEDANGIFDWVSCLRHNVQTPASPNCGATASVMTCPVKQSTSVLEIKMFLAMKLGIDPGVMSVVTKQGCSWRIQTDSEEIARKVMVKGIKSFKRERHKWPSPIAIIGTGHAGLRQAMFFLKNKEYNFIVYDRKALVGGTSWIDQANTTSKLQTELGTYHLQYDEDNPVPKNMSTWPSTAELLQHFREVSEEYGIMPYCKMCTNIKEIKIKTGTKQEVQAEMAQRGWATQTYTLTLEPTDGTGDGRGDNIGATGAPCEDVDHSAVIMYPGNLTIPKRCELPGEDTFEGEVSYAIMNDFDYGKVTGKQVAILGHGAFAVENLRTCMEFSCRQAYMVCRRKNLACPRVVSWFINQSVHPINGPLTMKSFLPMYNLLGFDPWNTSRTTF